MARLSGGTTGFDRGLIPLDAGLDLFGMTRGELQRCADLTRMQIGLRRQQIDTVLLPTVQIA